MTFLGNTLRTHRPEFLKEQIVLCNTVHKHNTRKASNGDIVQAHPKTNFRKRTVLYRASKIWNELPQDIRQEKSKISFKRRIKGALFLVVIWTLLFVGTMYAFIHVV